ncbi:Ras family protein [Dictyocaulus viviparus]|uniref:Ras family protein n=1 Tax=Dictyocaulus viviparus TaxID=29172 RepID=A0A0D8XVG0_DICVI|nr:Ras family protein [Dictyocaulus viviparus]
MMVQWKNVRLLFDNEICGRAFNSMNPKDFVDIKVVIVGDTAAGKTAILKRFFDETFEEEVSSTIGIDFRHVIYQLQDKTSVRLRVWDTAGQERFRHLSPSFIRDAHVILIVVDITSSNILEQIERWTSFVQGVQNNESLLIFVGNKCDLKQRSENKQIEKLIAEYNAPYIETSAKTGENIRENYRRPITKHLGVILVVGNVPDCLAVFSVLFEIYKFV